MVTTMMPSGAWSVVSAVVLGILLFAKLLSSRKYKNLPPGPWGLPVIGSVHLLGKFPRRDLTKLAETYGPLMSLWLGSRLVVVATSPAAAEVILKSKGSNFANRIATSVSNVLAPGECIRNPIVMKKAQAKLDTIVGKSRRVEEADVPNLKYLQAIIKENFRLHLIASILIPHLNEKACKVLEYDIREKTLVFVHAAAIAQDPKTWEDPMTFKPERFLDGMPHAHMQVEGQNFELLPSGAGRRQCLGIMLASTLVHIMVATFMQSFDWSLPNGLQPMDLDMSRS